MYELNDDKITKFEESKIPIKYIPWHWNMRSNDDGVIGMIPSDRFMWFDADSVQMHTVFLKDFPKVNGKIVHRDN